MPAVEAAGYVASFTRHTGKALMQISELPYLDEHATAIAAGVDDVWLVLTETLDRTFSRTHMTSYARTIRCADHTASGPRPLAEGSTIPGFRVAAATPGSELVLEGRHRFSTYALIFRLEQVNAGLPFLAWPAASTDYSSSGRVVT
jgi:hypothetical protein